MTKFFSNFKGDALGGITAGIVALPLALALGVSSGLGASAGLYGAIFISFFAALFGGTNTQISGPTAPMTAVSMLIVASIVATNNGNLDAALPLILVVFLLAGLLQILLGFIHIGEYIRYIPYPVISGFMTAIGLIIIITQILPAVGYYPKEDVTFVDSFKPQAQEIILKSILDEEAGKGVLDVQDFEQTIKRSAKISETTITQEAQTLAAKEASGTLGAFRVLPRLIQQINGLELALALGTIFIVFGFKRMTQKIPSTLVALVVMSIIAIVFNLDYRPIDAIPAGIPLPNFEIFTGINFTSVLPYVFTALTLAMLGAIDSLLTSVVADNMTKTKHRPNKELIGQGIGNSIAAIFGGIPGAGATIRTVVNINAGGKTRLSGMISGVLLFVIMLAFAPMASKIPAAVLAGILITVGVNVMDYKGLKAISVLPRDVGFKLKAVKIKFSSEVLVMLVVLALSTFWDLIYAVGIGLVMSSLIFMKKIGTLTASRSDSKQLKETIWTDDVKLPLEFKEHVYVRNVKGPLFFGSTDDFQALSAQIPTTAKIVIIRLGRMAYMDQSGLYAMEDMLLDLKRRHVIVLFIRLQKQPRFLMERIKVIPNVVTEDCIFEHFSECVQWLEKKLQNDVK